MFRCDSLWATGNNDHSGYGYSCLFSSFRQGNDVGFKLNDIPFSRMTGPEGRGYANPREVFRSLAGIGNS